RVLAPGCCPDRDRCEPARPQTRVDRLRDPRRPPDDDAVTVGLEDLVDDLGLAAPVAPAGAGGERVGRLEPLEDDAAAQDDADAEARRVERIQADEVAD